MLSRALRCTNANVDTYVELVDVAGMCRGSIRPQDMYQKSNFYFLTEV